MANTEVLSLFVVFIYDLFNGTDDGSDYIDRKNQLIPLY
jgi:hypothetical protein